MWRRQWRNSECIAILRFISLTTSMRQSIAHLPKVKGYMSAHVEF